MNWLKTNVGWIIGVLAAFVIGVLAGGGSNTNAHATARTSTVTQTATATETQAAEVQTVDRTVTKTVTTHTAAPPPQPVSTPPSGGGQLSFSGNGGKSLGTIVVPASATLHWTNDGGLFQIWDDDFGISVNSQGHSGTTAVDGGTYHHVYVNADGDWTITIE
jgi:hypothetical protein